jgi:hypothetical protein
MNRSFKMRFVITLTAAFALCKGAVAQGVPDRSHFDDATRQSIELACITQKTDGPVAYGGCLRAQLQSIGVQPDDTTHIQSAHAKRIDRKATQSSANPSTGLSQVTRRKHADPLHPWQDPIVLASLVLVFVYLIPVLWVLFSRRSHGGAKLGWFLVVLFFSWLGLAVFLIVTQPPRNRPDTRSGSTNL